jgi:hypothetical protein
VRRWADVPTEERLSGATLRVWYEFSEGEYTGEHIDQMAAREDGWMDSLLSRAYGCKAATLSWASRGAGPDLWRPCLRRDTTGRGYCRAHVRLATSPDESAVQIMRCPACGTLFTSREGQING